MSEEKLIHPTAERTVAAAIVAADERAADLLKQTTPTDYSSSQLRVIVEAVKRLLNGVEPIDTAAIVTECKAIVKEEKLRVAVTADYIEELRQTPTGRAVAYAATVKRMAWLRNFKDMVAWANAELDTLPDPDEMYKAALGRLDWLKPPTSDNRFVYGWDTNEYSGVLAQREAERAKGTIKHFAWPKQWGSWGLHVKRLRPGMVGLLSGPEGSGKTGYLEMIAETWALSHHVVFVHLENAIDYTLDRRMSRHARVPIDVLEDETLTDAQQRAVTEASARIHAFAPSLHYLDASGMTMAEIIAELRGRRDEGLCDAVVLDYLNKVRPSRGQVKLYGTNTFSRQADDLELFKNFCETPDKKIVGFTAAQFNKEGKRGKDRPDGTDIRGSGELMDKVQLAVLLQRTILDNEERDPTGRVLAHKGQKSRVIKVRVEKQNRGGEVDFEQIHLGEFFTIGDRRNV